jgi:hypothetical protein
MQLSGWPRIRFTLRDLLWFIIVIALAEAWWADHRHVNVEAARWRLISKRYEAGLHDIRRREDEVRAREIALGVNSNDQDKLGAP